MALGSLSVSIRHASILCLVAQHVGTVLLIRFSHRQETDGSQDSLPYIVSTAVLLTEVFKLILNTFLAWYHHESSHENASDSDIPGVVAGNDTARFWQHFLRQISTDKPHLMAIPAFLYLVQNNLLFVALKNLTVPVFQVLTQGKHLCTALCSYWFLGRVFSKKQSISLFILIGGLALVNLSDVINKHDDSASSQNTTDNEQENLSGKWIGLLAVFVSCWTSGFAGVYFEKIIKGDDELQPSPTKAVALITIPAVYTLNVQLALWSLMLGVFSLIKDWKDIQSNGFLQGYNAYVWMIVVSQAFAGLAVAMVIKYADAMVKGLVVSASDVLAIVLALAWFDDSRPCDAKFLIGVATVFLAVLLYTTRLEDLGFNVSKMASILAPSPLSKMAGIPGAGGHRAMPLRTWILLVLLCGASLLGSLSRKGIKLQVLTGTVHSLNATSVQ